LWRAGGIVRILSRSWSPPKKVAAAKWQIFQPVSMAAVVRHVCFATLRNRRHFLFVAETDRLLAFAAAPRVVNQ